MVETVESAAESKLDLVEERLIKVLHVDDETGFTKASKQILENSGRFSVDLVTSVEEAMEKLEDHVYDVIVSDYQMSEKNGLQFLKELRKAGNTIPFILFTGKGREDVAIQALNLGADRYINKLGGPETVFTELKHEIQKTVKSKENERAREMVQKRLENVFVASPDAITVTDLNGTIIDCNKATLDLYGFSNKEEVIGKNAFDYITEKDRLKALENMKKVLDQGAVKNVEYASLRSDGSIFKAELSASVIRDASGHPSSFVGITKDITKRKKSEEALQKSEERYKQLFEQSRVLLDNIPDFIMALDRKGIAQYVNRTTSDSGQTPNVDPEQMVGKPIWNLIKPEFRPLHQSRLQQVFKTGKPVEVKFTSTFNKVIHSRLVPIQYQGKVAEVIAIAQDVTERKKAEEALGESEERYRTFFESTKDGIIISGPEGKVLSSNPAAATILGYESPQKLLGVSMLNFYSDPEERKTLFEKLMKQGYLRDFEVTGKRKDGKQVTATVSLTLHKDKEDNILRIEGIFRDITERKKAEEELRENEERLSLAQSSAKLGMFDWNIKTNTAVCSKEFFDIWGVKPKIMTYEDWLKGVHPDDRKKVISTVKQAFAGKQTDIEYRIVLPNKKIKWISAKGKVHFDKNDKPKRMTGIHVDITERKNAEEALKESENRFRSLIESAAAGVCILDLEGCFTYVNEALADMVGYPVSELIGHRFTDFLPYDDRKIAAQRFNKEALVGVDIEPFDFQITSRDGRVLHLASKPTGLTVDGKIIAFHAIITDITDHKRVEENLRKTKDKLETINEKLRITSNLTRHDVGNKLSTILNNGYLARQTLDQNHEATNYIGEIESACKQIERTFGLAKTYEMLGVEDRFQVNLEKSFDEAASLFPKLRNTIMVNELEGLTVRADSLLTQVFFNLIDNSLKYGEKVSQIRVYHEELKDKIRLVYEDDGIGIPSKEKKKIFQEGYGKGTGYGLHLTRRICELYGWKIKETGKFGDGVRFFIDVPHAETYFESLVPFSKS
jgi:PAS domain S-box-containing protein